MNWLEGKRTYLIIGLGIAGTWAAYGLGIPDPQCVPAINAACEAVSLQNAIGATVAGLAAAFLRMGSKTDADKAAQVIASAALSKGALEDLAAGALKPSQVPGGTSRMKPVV